MKQRKKERKKEREEEGDLENDDELLFYTLAPETVCVGVSVRDTGSLFTVPYCTVRAILLQRPFK